MEILFVSHKYPPATGGMEMQSYALIHGVSPYAKVHKLVYTGEGSIFFFFWNLNKRIIERVREHPDIAVIHFNDGLIGSFALRHTGYDHLQKVVTIHGLDITFPWTYFQQKILPKFNQFDKIIAVSNATAVAALQRGIDSSKLIVINNGVDHMIAKKEPISIEDLQKKYPKIQAGKSYFMTLGRPVKRKGFSWLVREVVPKIERDFQVIMVGPFASKRTISEWLLSLLPQKIQQKITLFLGYPTDQHTLRSLLPDADDRVVHLGKIPFEDLSSLLAHASVFLMPNIEIEGDMEGFGLVCLEASLAGTLVLASAIEGINDAIVHQKNGLLVPSQNAAIWVSRLQTILDNPRYFADKIPAFRQYTLDHYSWDQMAKAYLQTFQNLLK